MTTRGAKSSCGSPTLESGVAKLVDKGKDWQQSMQVNMDKLLALGEQQATQPLFKPLWEH